MGHIAILIFLIGSASFLLLGKEKSKTKRLFQKITGIAILIGVLANVFNTINYLNQIYFLEDKSIAQIDLIPYEEYCSNQKKAKYSVSLTSYDKILKLQQAFSNLKTKSPQQPNCKKSFWISFKEKNGKSYSYIVKHTENNGTLVSADINWISFGTYRNDEIFNTIFDITKLKFYDIN